MSTLFTSLLLCYQMRITQIQIESDSNLLVLWYNRSAPTPRLLCGLMDKIRELFVFVEIHISHIYREGNMVVNGLAKHSSMGCDMQYFLVQYLPSDIQRRWISDMLQLPTWREPK